MTVGNVVTAGLRIYRDRFKTYYSLALKAYLWILVPIYGWAKFWAIQGLISRLAFAEINEQPETVREAEGKVMSRMWSFLGARILIFLIFLGFFLGAVIVFVVFGMSFDIIFKPYYDKNFYYYLLLFLCMYLFPFIIALTWLVARFFVVEAALAMEDNISARKAIDRSWQLTKSSVKRIQSIVFVTFLLTIPVSILFKIAEQIIKAAFTTGLSMAENDVFTLLYWVFIVGVNIAIFALLIPFWQCIKAATYYDFRNRREGLDLKLQDRLK